MLSLPVLRLPHLALKEVLKCWNPIELFTFSQCSRKAARVIPLAGTRNFHLSCQCYRFITINRMYMFEIGKTRRRRIFEMNLVYQCHSIDCAVEIVAWDECISFWADQWDGFRKFIFYLSDLFQCHITSYSITSYTSDLTVLQFLQFGQEIVGKQDEIKQLSIEFGSKNSNDFPAFLNDSNVLNVTETLYLYTIGVEASGDVEYKFAGAPKCFILNHARWFTRKTLQSLENCTLIDLNSPGLVHKDVNELVNLWKSGRFSALEYFQIKLAFEPGSPIGGLINLKDYSNRMRRIKKIYRHTYDVLEGAVIQRDDGQKADVRLNFWEEKFKLLVHSEKDKFEYVELITID
ncbi:hypothetical protein CAEBREN_16471 [Caenorhabditis brenneri]|uniref:F-box domain-containing protein n=1 Tax=Caenorhabditis brenneri TaxID=135651 RepID=G0N2M5_CAEBE|nr:hypothetical protein CAEBREN_16471 [Caenorhabditis brenneri]